MTNFSWNSLKGRQPTPIFVTAYDAAFARLAREAGAAGLIVGDTVGPLALGHASAADVSFAEMLHHATAVRRGADGLPVMADLPLACIGRGSKRAAELGRRLVEETGIDAVKLEGASPAILRVIELLRSDGIRVVGHLEGSSPTSADDARRLTDAGVVAIVLVSMDAGVAGEITRTMRVPTIGKATGPSCDAQVVNAYQALGIVGGDPNATVRTLLRNALTTEPRKT